MKIFKKALFAVSLLCGTLAFAADAPLKALCTTYPIYQIARNVVEGSKTLKLELLIPPGTGCPHDYALTPQDMKRLAGASILIVNGLKMETFLGAPIKQANPRIAVLDSSNGIKETLEYSGEEIDHEGARAEDDEHNGVNPHLFASPKMAALIAANIGDGLAKLDPASAKLYKANAAAYAVRMDKLAAEFSALCKTLKNRKVVTEHGVFDYLARDAGLQIVGVVRAYEEESQAPSAAAIIRIVKLIKERKVGALFTEPQYPDAIGKTIASEAGIPVAKMDPVASGPVDAPLDYYEKTMRANMGVLKAALGGE